MILWPCSARHQPKLQVHGHRAIVRRHGVTVQLPWSGIDLEKINVECQNNN